MTWLLDLILQNELLKNLQVPREPINWPKTSQPNHEFAHLFQDDALSKMPENEQESFDKPNQSD